MISKTSGLMKYLALMIGATYILSVGSVYAQNNQTDQTSQDVTGPTDLSPGTRESDERKEGLRFR
jgi:hypothetical protein